MDEKQEFNHLAEMKMNPCVPSTTQLLQMEDFLSGLLSFMGSNLMNNLSAGKLEREIFTFTRVT